jgi:hypothetical protein
MHVALHDIKIYQPLKTYQGRTQKLAKKFMIVETYWQDHWLDKIIGHPAMMQ